MKKLWKKYSFVILLIIIVAGMFNPKIALMATICMLGPIVTSPFKGRYWCRNICPRGNLYDNTVSKLSRHKGIPRIFKKDLFRVLIIIVMFTLFGVQIKNSGGDVAKIGITFYRMVFGTTIIGIILSLPFNHRSWCSFCPMGSIADFINRLKS